MTPYKISQNDRVRMSSRPELGLGEVLRVSETAGFYQADVVFEGPDGRRLEVIPVDLLEKAEDLWARLAKGPHDPPSDYALKQTAWELAYANSGGELSASRVKLLPHQILLVHDLIATTERRVLVADEVGLGKTIETGMLLRELIARREAERILIITPAGLIKQWQRELRECFGLHFSVLGTEFQDYGPSSWEGPLRVIGSIDTLKQEERKRRLLGAAPWDAIVVDEAHHLSRTRSGSKINSTLNYRLAEALRGRTRDLIFLSATPHQGNAFQFWSLIQLLNDQLFATPEEMTDHRGLLARVMIRRTKREVTDPAGNSIFRRRQVHTQSFSLAPREREFYERLSDYLREGYTAAGIGKTRTTSRERAIGFVMVTFQKIMSSSPRAIRQALRRRRLVLLARKLLELEGRRRRGEMRGEDILRIQDSMIALALEILGHGTEHSDAESYVARIRRQVIKKSEIRNEETSWSLDGDEDGDEAVFAEADIKDEEKRVRELIDLVPSGSDRRFDTLARAISDLSRNNPNERFVIFTQYRDTMEFLMEELGQIYGRDRIASIRGGPLADKIAAMESFWNEGGAQFLICTSAGAEGINLQKGHILFNYDLPWNPMAVEQRIGRVHRYGQEDTVQVYNLIAEDTVEEKIYAILDQKLGEIAHSLGKTDADGNPLEDFRSDILGFLGSRPDYQELYKQALFFKDYTRTQAEISRMMIEAARAKEALEKLTQDMSGFNLEHYQQLEGRYSLTDLGEWLRSAVLRLKGAALPAGGDLWTLITPDEVRSARRLFPRYERVCFDRDLALRVKGSEIGGIGHPLVDTMLHYVRGAAFAGEVGTFGKDSSTIYARYLIEFKDSKGMGRGRIVTLAYDTRSCRVIQGEGFRPPKKVDAGVPFCDLEGAKTALEAGRDDILQQWYPTKESRAGLRIMLIGLHWG